MNALKEKMYDYEVTPPDEVWPSIVAGLSNTKVIPAKGTQRFSYTAIAASVLLFIIVSIFFQLRPERQPDQQDKYIVLNQEDLQQKAVEKVNYITLLGPQGKVKVSKKVAEIFIAPETPTKAEWNKKLKHWKSIMMTASNTDFMDVIPLTQNAETEN